MHSSSLSVCSMTRSSLSKPVCCPISQGCPLTPIRSHAATPSAYPFSRRSPWDHLVAHQQAVHMAGTCLSSSIDLRHSSSRPLPKMHFNVCTNCETEDASFRVHFFLDHSVVKDRARGLPVLRTRPLHHASSAPRLLTHNIVHLLDPRHASFLASTSVLVLQRSRIASAP